MAELYLTDCIRKLATEIFPVREWDELKSILFYIKSRSLNLGA